MSKHLAPLERLPEELLFLICDNIIISSTISDIDVSYEHVGNNFDSNWLLNLISTSTTLRNKIGPLMVWSQVKFSSLLPSDNYIFEVRPSETRDPRSLMNNHQIKRYTIVDDSRIHKKRYRLLGKFNKIRDVYTIPFLTDLGCHVQSLYLDFDPLVSRPEKFIECETYANKRLMAREVEMYCKILAFVGVSNMPQLKEIHLPLMLEAKAKTVEKLRKTYQDLAVSLAAYSHPPKLHIETSNEVLDDLQATGVLSFVSSWKVIHDDTEKLIHFGLNPLKNLEVLKLESSDSNLFPFRSTTTVYYNESLFSLLTSHSEIMCSNLKVLDLGNVVGFPVRSLDWFPRTVTELICSSNFVVPLTSKPKFDRTALQSVSKLTVVFKDIDAEEYMTIDSDLIWALPFFNLTDLYIKSRYFTDYGSYISTAVMTAIMEMMGHNHLQSFAVDSLDETLFDDILPLLKGLTKLAIFDHTAEIEDITDYYDEGEKEDTVEDISFLTSLSLYLVNRILAQRPENLKNLWIDNYLSGCIYYPLLKNLILSNACPNLEYIVSTSSVDPVSFYLSSSRAYTMADHFADFFELDFAITDFCFPTNLNPYTENGFAEEEYSVHEFLIDIPALRNCLANPKAKTQRAALTI